MTYGCRLRHATPPTRNVKVQTNYVNGENNVQGNKDFVIVLDPWLSPFEGSIVTIWKTKYLFSMDTPEIRLKIKFRFQSHVPTIGSNFL